LEVGYDLATTYDDPLEVVHVAIKRSLKRTNDPWKARAMERAFDKTQVEA
jgi:hypothetical protein